MQCAYIRSQDHVLPTDPFAHAILKTFSAKSGQFEKGRQNRTIVIKKWQIASCYGFIGTTRPESKKTE